MADTDSFISEVTEEVRRDRLFAFFRKWAWLFVLVVVVIVGFAGFTEYRRAQNEASAQAFGDNVIASLNEEDVADRISALQAITPANPEAEMLLALLLAGQEVEAGTADAAAERLRAIAARDDMPMRYRDLAALKAHMLSPGDRAEAMVMLDRLSQPGAPYRGLAIEQQAYLHIADGEVDEGRALLEELLGSADVTRGLQERVLGVMLALDTGAALTDIPLPQEDAVDLLELPVGEPVADEPGTAAPEDGSEEAAGDTRADADADADATDGDADATGGAADADAPDEN